MFSVDAIFEERLPSTIKNKKLLAKPLRAILRLLFHESEFHQFEKKHLHIEGMDFVEEVLKFFDFDYAVRSQEIERIPNTGRVVIIANHPIGTLDGLALLKLINTVRPDVRVVANELLMAVKPLQSLLLPVDNMDGRTKKDNIKAIDAHLNNEGALIIFPAGEVSRISPSGIKDGVWNSGFLRFANKTRSPVLPIYVNARNSFLFYSMSLLAKPLSTVLLVREMFLQASNTAEVHVGELIPPESWQNMGGSLKKQSKLFRKHLYRIAKRKSPILKPVAQAIAHPENRQLIRQDIRRCESLGETPDGKKIVLYRPTPDSFLLREIGRLRELSFRQVGEGSGKRRDSDHYDMYYDHIILWDDYDLEIVGAYRMVRTAANNIGDNKIYSETLFSYTNEFSDIREQGLELGRSFVQPRYWGKRSLEYLWHGIAAYIKRYPSVKYLYGPVSISATYSSTARDLLVQFYLHYFSVPAPLAKPKTEHLIAADNKDVFNTLFEGNNLKADFLTIKSTLNTMGFTVPTLYKQYSELCEDKGVLFTAFNIDPDFNYCIDGLVVVDIDKLKPRKKSRYFGDWERLDVLGNASKEQADKLQNSI